MTRHKYADILEAIAEGKQIQVNTNSDTPEVWIDLSPRQALEHMSYDSNYISFKVKPEVKYPSTSIPKEDLYDFAFSQVGTWEVKLKLMADFVIKQFIIDNDLNPEEYV